MIRAIVLVALVATGCGPALQHIPPLTEARGIDFRPHAADGFLFSPNAYPGAFDPVGLVTVAVYAEGTRREASGARLRDDRDSIWVFSRLTAQDVLAAARREATALGADAIVNLAIKPTTRVVSDRRIGLTVPGLELTGFAIKRR